MNLGLLSPLKQSRLRKLQASIGQWDMAETHKWVRKIIRSPESAVPLLQKLPPPLAKHALTYASELLEPQLWGSRIRLRELRRDRLWLELPAPLRAFVEVAPSRAFGTLLSSAEWGFRLLWSQQSHLQDLKFRVIHAEVVLLKEVSFPLWLRGDVPASLIEGVQLALLKKSEVTWNWSLRILSDREVEVGSITLKILWHRQRQLASS